MNIKVTISKVVLVVFIITNFLGQASGNNSQSMLPYYDIWTNLRNLEEKKAYATLATFLESMLEQMTVTQEKNAGQKNNTATIDIEGMVYLLDDLAEVYTTGIINFQKALTYNKRALDTYEKIKTIGLKNTTFSEYFNQRRMLYYYFYPLNKEFGDRTLRKIREGEKYFYNRKDLATFFDEDFLNTVRETDLEELKQRVNNRGKYLDYKLGMSSHNVSERKTIRPPASSNQNLLEKHDAVTSTDLSSQKRGIVIKPLTSGNIGGYDRLLESDSDIELIRKLLEKENIYNTYYKNFYLASKLWLIHKKGGEIDYNKLISLCREAIAVEKEQRLKDDKDSYNFLKYWLGLSYLKIGNIKEGTYHIKGFFRGVDEMDEVEEEITKKRRLLIGKAVDEKRAGWETFGVILGLAGIVASWAVAIQGMAAAQSASMGTEGSYSSIQGLVASQHAAQQTAQNILQQSMITSTLMHVCSQSLAWITTAPQIDTESYVESKRLSGLVSPFVLKVGRYLDKFDQVELYADLGKGYEKLGKNTKAIRYYMEALSIVEIQRSTISTESQRISFFALKESLYKDIVRLLVIVGRTEEAFDFVERAKARAFLDILSGNTSLVLKSPEETAVFSLEMVRREEISALLDQTKLGIEQVRNVLIKPKPVAIRSDFDYLTNKNTITAKEALLVTKGDFSILEYFLTDEAIYIFLLDGGKLFVKELPIDNKKIFKLINSYRNGIASQKIDLQELRYSSSTFYKLLVEPVRGMITAKRLFIIPHSWLHYIPFQALQKEDKYLIEEFAITYAPSVTILKLCLDKDKKSKEPILIFSNPHINYQHITNIIDSLPYAEDEALSIAKNFKNTTLFLRHQATETLFKENASKYGMIHIAAHAFFDKENPLNSAILLSADSKNDGVLTVSEIYQTKLNAYLVVLSACESGLTYVSRGDELIGFIRALMYSGANTILSSLWNVDDKSTAYLMKTFYENLNTLPKDIALQKAQVETMKIFPHPYNWSPFILTGSYD